MKDTIIVKGRVKLSEAEYSDIKAEMRAVMVECARARETITYSDLALRLQTAYIHPHSFLMVRLLDDIGRDEYEAGRGILPAVVVRKSSGIPGGGYFRQGGGSGPERDPDDLETWWREDLEALFEYWADK